MATATEPGGNIYFTTAAELTDPAKDQARAKNRDSRDAEVKATAQGAVDTAGTALSTAQGASATAKGAATTASQAVTAATRAAGAAETVQRVQAGAIADAAQAKATAGTALSKASSAEGLTKNLEVRTDALETLGGLAPGSVSDATVTSLVAQADSDTRNAVNTASVQALSPRVGATRVDVVNSAATLDGAGIQAVINAAPAGAEFYFSTEGGREINLNGGRLRPSAAGQKFIHEQGVALRQSATHTPVYDVLDRDDITIHDLTAVGPATRSASGTASRGSSSANEAAAVWSNSNRTRVTGRLSATNFKIGVNLTAWDTASQAWKSAAHADNQVENVEAVGSDFGVLYYGQKRLTLGRVSTRGHIDSSGLTDPNHAVYGSGSASIRSSAVTIGTVLCDGLAYGHVVTMKHTDGWTLAELVADKCATLITTIDTVDFQIGHMALRSSIASTGGAAHTVEVQAGTRRGTIGSAYINDTANATPGSLFYGELHESTIGQLTTISRRTSEGTDVNVAGDDLTISAVKTIAAGAASRSLQIFRGNRVTIGGHASVNASRVITFAPDSKNSVYRYTPSAHAGGTFTGTGIIRETGSTATIEGEPGAPVGYAVKTANATLTADEQTVIANGAATINLPLPTNLPAHMRDGKTYTVKNIGSAQLDVRVQGGAGTIDGAASVPLAKNASARFICHNGAWYTL